MVVATWLAGQRQKRPLADYGIPQREIFGARFWERAVWGIALLSAMLLVRRVTGNFEIQSVSTNGKVSLRLRVVLGSGFFALLPSAKNAVSPATCCSCFRDASCRSSLLGFSFVLRFGEPAIFGLPLGFTVLGLGGDFLLRRSRQRANWRRPFLACTFHSPAKLSGGSAGPEGSIRALLALVLAAFFVQLRFPRLVYPDRPR